MSRFTHSHISGRNTMNILSKLIFSRSDYRLAGCGSHYGLKLFGRRRH